MLPFGRRFAIFVVVLGLTSRVAQAGVVITIQQVGSNEVDVTGSGSLNLSALTPFGSFTQPPDMIPFDAEVIVGTTAGGSVTGYAGASFSGPTTIPPGTGTSVSKTG